MPPRTSGEISVPGGKAVRWPASEHSYPKPASYCPQRALRLLYTDSAAVKVISAGPGGKVILELHSSTYERKVSDAQLTMLQ